MASGAVVARILTQYSDKGSKAAQKDFAKMGQKFKDFSNKAMKAFGVAAVAAGAFAVKIGTDAVKAAMEDQQSQAMLANSLRGTIGATDDAIAATEKWISKTQLAYGVADDELRPAFGRLAAVTGDVASAQNMLGVAMDISAARNMDMESAASLLAKAYGGNIGALKKLFPQISAATVKSKDFGKAMQEIQSEIGGAAATKAKTFAGQINRIKIAFGEASESLGYKLLPYVQKFADLIITKVVPAVQQWVEENGDKIAIIFQQGIAYGIAFAKMIGEVFKFVSDNIKVFAVLGAVIVAAFAGAKVAAAVTALIGAIKTIIKFYRLLRTEGLAAAFATSLATGGVSAATGAAAFALALGGMALMVRKFNKDADKASEAMGDFKFDVQDFTGEADKYTKGVNKMVIATNKLTKAQKENALVEFWKRKIFERFGIKVKSDDLDTLGAVWANLMRQNFGVMSPTISLAASAGAGGSINSSVSGNNAPGITINVAGSVVSDADLVALVQNGLDTLYQRSGTSKLGRGGTMVV